MRIVVDGIEVEVTRKKMRNIRMRLDDSGLVKVSAPYGTPTLAIELFVRGQKDWIARAQAKRAASPSAAAADATPAETKRWRREVEAATPPLIAKWEAIIGVKAGTLAYRNMKSRWGSCQPSTGRICINTRLALYPPECLEYVVVHELCHLLEANHSPRFHALMTKYLPDWKRRRALLK